MPEAKIKPTSASIEECLALRAGAEQVADCRALMEQLTKVTKQSPKMLGPSIVGYAKASLIDLCVLIFGWRAAFRTGCR